MHSARKVRNAFSMLVLAQAACVPMSAIDEGPVITYSSNAFPIYSSASKSVSRQMCDSLEVVTLSADLPATTLRKIATLAEQSGFFALPAGFAEPKPQLHADDNGEEYWEVRSAAPCWETSLEIAYHGKRNRVAWSCMGDAIANSRSEVVALRGALNPYFEKLPRQPCFLR